MDKEQLAKLVAEKIDAALKAGDHPKKFFITANGRGVTDGGELYNAVLKDVLGVVSVALVDIFTALMAPAKTSEKPEKLEKPDKPDKPEKPTKSSSKK